MFLDKDSVKQEYSELLGRYNKLGTNLSQALEFLIVEEKIPILSINFRIKSINSFLGKIVKKGYNKPFDEIEDICGLRIICYYQSDIEKIKKILDKNLEVLENVNKEDNLKADQFGYRSMHFIVKIPATWIKVPNYKGLKDLKAEIQVRTVLMHAWAEIEHELAYKSSEQIPTQFRREFSRISAQLETADKQFEEIKKNIIKNIKSVTADANKNKEFKEDIEFNLDSLQSFLDYAFPDRDKIPRSTSQLFEEMKQYKISLKELIKGFNDTKDLLDEIEKESSKYFEQPVVLKWAQVGAARTILELTNDEYFSARSFMPDVETLQDYRVRLKQKK